MSHGSQEPPVGSAPTEDLAAEFEREGFVVLRNLLSSSDLELYRRECDRLASQPLDDPDGFRTLYRTTGEGSERLERLDPVVDVSPVFARLARHPRLLGVVQHLLADEALLLKDKLILKPPEMSGYLCHQDHAWWQLCKPNEVVSAHLALDPADAGNGCVGVFPGWHTGLLTPPGERRNLTALERQQLPSEPCFVTLGAGDVLIFSALLPHESHSNTSSRPRRSVCFSYNAARVGDLYRRQRQQYIDMKMDEIRQQEAP